MPLPLTAPDLLGLTRVDWGRTPYMEACERQAALVAQRIAGDIGDTLVFTEHDPVFTVGVRGGAESHLLWNPQQLEREGVEVAKTNRGGDITYHGPGQIVCYPIVSLAPRPDLHAYLRFLEEVLIAVAAGFDLRAARRPGLTGIWIDSRKIAAIGIAVRRWVASHGFALNINVDLHHFSGIVPCGIANATGTVTSLREELGKAVDVERVRAAIASEFARRWPEFLAGAPGT